MSRVSTERAVAGKRLDLGASDRDGDWLGHLDAVLTRDGPEHFRADALVVAVPLPVRGDEVAHVLLRVRLGMDLDVALFVVTNARYKKKIAILNRRGVKRSLRWLRPASPIALSL